MIIMSTVGAITDVVIAITLLMRKVFLHTKHQQNKIFHSGLRIGKDILGSNTLFFAFIGSYLTLILWFRDLSYSLGEIVNMKVFGAEMLTIFCAGIGIAMVIPIASGIYAWYLTRKPDKEQAV